jgi:hypothetical protein
MRKLLVLLVLGTVLWSGYWFAGSSALRQGAENWFAQSAARGLTAEKTALGVAGFPNRFDLTVEGLRLADPARGIGWQAPFAQVFAMTWKPWHIIAALPPDQVVTLPDQDVALQSEDLRASLRARPAPDLPLAMAVVETGAITARSTLGWTVAADRAVLSLGAAPDTPNGYDLAADIAALAPDPALIARLAPDGSLPPQIAAIKFRARATLSAPLDRHMGATRPQLQALELTETLVTWGDVLLAAQGRIGADADGFAAGRIEISLTNWRRILPVLVASGTVKPELAQTVETMLAGLAQQSGNPDVLKLPLVLQDGWMSLGPLPLGPAPLLVPPSG